MSEPITHEHGARGEANPVPAADHPMMNAKVKDRETGLWWGVGRVYDGGETNYDGFILFRRGEERRVSGHILDKWPQLYAPGHPAHDPAKYFEVVI